MHHAVRQHAVGKRARKFVVDTWQTEAILSFFLGLLVVMVFVLPLTNFVSQHTNIYVETSFSLMLLCGMALARRSRIAFYLAVFLGVVTIAARWTYLWHPAFNALREALTLVDIVFLAALLLAQVLAKGHVTSTRIQGAVAVYLLSGIAWAHGYHMVNALNPHSFVVQTGTPSSPSEWVYYSFTTLTTLGYGDIVPITRVSRMLCMGEAVFGQLYIAVMLARLVAIQVTESFIPSDSS